VQPVFSDCESHGGAVSEDLFERGLCIPAGSNLSRSDLEQVVEVITREWGSTEGSRASREARERASVRA
jgi:dTDP-4-amino-4,6-dideoxygalactose transaminase